MSNESLERMCKNWKRRYDEQMQENAKLRNEIVEIEKSKFEFKQKVWKDFNVARADAIKVGIRKAADFLDLFDDCDGRNPLIYSIKIRDAFLRTTTIEGGEDDGSSN